MLSAFYKFSKKDASCNCAQTKQIYLFLQPFLSFTFAEKQKLRATYTDLQKYMYVSI